MTAHWRRLPSPAPPAYTEGPLPPPPVRSSMSLFHSMRILRRWFSSAQADPEGLLARAELERVFQRESALAERLVRPFSMVVFTSEEHERDFELASTLVHCLRLGDVAGRLDRERIAVMLIGADREGAWRFVDRALARLGERRLIADCRVYVDLNEQRQTWSQAPEEDEDRTPPQSGSGGGGEGQQPLRPLEGGPAAAMPAPLPAEKRSNSLRLLRPQEPVERPVGDLDQLGEHPMPRAKRAMDVVCSGTALLILSPLLVTLAALVKFSSPGPVLFVQRRAGVGGRPFNFYKFRSMHADAEDRKAELQDQNEADGPIFKIKEDPRVTPIGRVLRRYSLDELPQLYNVLKGDMSLVGPRPPTLDEVANYEKWHRKRLSLKGGLTCTWQVSGRSDVSFTEWMRMDARYAKRRNLGTDLRLILRTVRAVATGRGAY